MLEEIAALEISIWMDNGVEIRLAPGAVLLHLLDLGFVNPLEDSVAGNVVPSLFYILSYLA